MKKRLQYFNEIQIMRNGMEQVKTTNGSLTVWPEEVQTGESGTFKLTYTVGEDIIEIGGVVRFTIPFGFTKPQTEMPIFPGYTTARTTRSNASVHIFFVENDWWKRGPDRTKTENVSEHVGTHIWVKVLGHALTKGDQIILIYGDTSYQAQAAAHFCRTTGPVQFDAATDRAGTLEAPYSGYYLTENPPTVMVHAKEAAFFEVIIPSQLEAGKETELTVLAIDRYHNLSVGHCGALVLKIGDSIIYKGSFEKEDCGIKKILFKPEFEGIYRVCANDLSGKLSGESNPGICSKKMEETKYFWGDLHGHTGIQWGRGSGRSYYEYAKEAAALDFCALTDPDAGRYTNNNETAHLSLSCYMSEGQWEEIKELNKSFYEEGRFVPLLGYEYHNDAPAPEFGGDRNVYYESYEEPVRRCVDQGSYCPGELWEQLKKKHVRAITIPHHTAKKVMLGSFEIHDEELQRLVEIYSGWGNSEGEGCERPIIGGSVYEKHSVQYGLGKGYRLGFVAGSDTHAGTPGYSHWVFSEGLESYRGGLTCVMTGHLDKESIFDALWNRSVYATTGERILLKFTLNGMTMGGELSLEHNKKRILHVEAVGTGLIDVVEIISMGHVVYRKKGEGKEMTFDWQDDSQPEAGWLYYYVRLYQNDKAIAWSSPIWVS